MFVFSQTPISKKSSLDRKIDGIGKVVSAELSSHTFTSTAGFLLVESAVGLVREAESLRLLISIAPLVMRRDLVGLSLAGLEVGEIPDAAGKIIA